MAIQNYDHSGFVGGVLRKYQKIGWGTQVVLGQGARSIWLMQAKHIDHNSGQRGIELQIEHYSKDTNAAVFGDAKKSFVLKEEAVKNLFNYLQQQQAIGNVALGSGYIAIPITPAAGRVSDRNLGALVSLFQELLGSGELERLLTDGLLSRESLRHIGIVAQHLRYKLALGELEKLLAGKHDEHMYQKWFDDNPWIFGTIYVRRIAGRDIGMHEQVDLLLETTDGYLDMIELKRPDVTVLQYDKSRKLHYFASDVSMAVAQCANYIAKSEENRHMLAQREGMMFLKPRARIIVGRSCDWDKSQHDALRMLNGSMHYIEVWTYDYLVSMGQQLMTLYEKGAVSGRQQKSRS